MEDQGGAHRLGVGLPATRRPLDISEQERHRPRRRSDPHKARSYAPLEPPSAAVFGAR